MPISKKKQEQLADEVRKLRKKKENLVCADCPQRNTTYVNVKFSTFVCTDCSGALRALSIPGIRCKSIHAASFSQEEVDKLREGGNAACNKMYLAKFKNGKNGVSLPEPGDARRLAEFLSWKYEDKRWYGEKGSGKKKSKKKKSKKEPVIQVVESSSDSDSSDSESSSEQEPEPVVVQPKKTKKGKKKSKKSKKKKTVQNDLFDTTANVSSVQDEWAAFDENDWNPFPEATAKPAAQPAQDEFDIFSNPTPQQPQPVQNNLFGPPQPQQNVGLFGGPAQQPPNLFGPPQNQPSNNLFGGPPQPQQRHSGLSQQRNSGLSQQRNSGLFNNAPQVPVQQDPMFADVFNKPKPAENKPTSSTHNDPFADLIEPTPPEESNPNLFAAQPAAPMTYGGQPNAMPNPHMNWRAPQPNQWNQPQPNQWGAPQMPMQNQWNPQMNQPIPQPNQWSAPQMPMQNQWNPQMTNQMPQMNTKSANPWA